MAGKRCGYEVVMAASCLSENCVTASCMLALGSQKKRAEVHVLRVYCSDYRLGFKV